MSPGILEPRQACHRRSPALVCRQRVGLGCWQRPGDPGEPGEVDDQTARSTRFFPPGSEAAGDYWSCAGLLAVVRGVGRTHRSPEVKSTRLPGRRHMLDLAIFFKIFHRRTKSKSPEAAGRTFGRHQRVEPAKDQGGKFFSQHSTTSG